MKPDGFLDSLIHPATGTYLDREGRRYAQVVVEHGKPRIIGWCSAMLPEQAIKYHDREVWRKYLGVVTR